MVLMAQSGINHRPSTSQVKSWKLCFNFAKGSCRFGSECKYVHDSNAKPTSNVNPQSSSTNNTEELLVKLLDKLGLKSTSYNATGTVPLHTPSANLVYHVPGPNASTPSPTANPPYYTNPIQSTSPTPGTSPMLPTDPTPFYYPPGPTGPPPGFSQPTARPHIWAY
ncbi:ribonuclease H-like domain-containing protein [Tanacetum coccineum]